MSETQDKSILLALELLNGKLNLDKLEDKFNVFNEELSEFSSELSELEGRIEILEREIAEIKEAKR